VNAALAVGIGCIVVALAVVAWAATELTNLWLRIKAVEEAQRRFYERASALEGYRDEHRTRLDALEKRPPLVNVAVQMQPPAAKPGKAGAK
jgi:uncharacterized membrane protein YccC